MKKLLLSFVAIICTTTFAFAETITHTGQCGNNATWTVSWPSDDSWNQTLTISGSGAIWDYPHNGDNSPVSGVSYTHIRKVIIGNSITRVGDAFFSRSLSLCDGVNSFTWSSGLKSIGKRAFAGADIDPITLPNNLETIEDEAFDGCHYTHFVTIPASVTYIAPSAFRNIHLLETITVNASNKVYASYEGVLYNKEMTKLILIPLWCKPNDDRRLDIPKGVKIIAEKAFSEYSDARLRNIVLPMSVEQIGAYGISNSALEKLSCARPVPPTAQATSFSSTPADIPVYIPTGTTAAYQAATGWSKFTNFIETDFPNDCKTPTNFALVGEPTFNSATFSFTPGASEQTGWGLRYKKTSESLYQTSPNRVANTGAASYNIILSGLEPETEYDVVVFAVCGASLNDDGDISYDSAPITITTTTVPAPQTKPTVENGWAYYGQNTFGGIGELASYMYYGMMIPANTSTDDYLDSVRVYAASTDIHEISLWEGGNTPAAAKQVWKQEFTPENLNDFTGVKLLEPLKVNKLKNLWVFSRVMGLTLACSVTYASGVNAPNARWIGITGGDVTEWKDIQSIPELSNLYIAWLVNPHYTKTPTYVAYVKDLTATKITTTSITLSWFGKGTFELRWRKQSETEWKTKASISKKTYTITGLEATNTYEIQVRATYNGETTEWSDVLSVYIAENAAIDEIQIDKPQSTKTIIDGQLYIIHDGKMYNASGMRVR